LGVVIAEVAHVSYLRIGGATLQELRRWKSAFRPQDKVCFRRILLVAGEGRLTEHITATQAQPPEPVFMPRSGLPQRHYLTAALGVDTGPSLDTYASHGTRHKRTLETANSCILTHDP